MSFSKMNGGTFNGNGTHLSPGLWDRDGRSDHQNLKTAYYDDLMKFYTAKKHVRKVVATMLCVHCSKVPNPRYYYNCDKCGRFLCGSCAYSTEEPEKKSKQITGIVTCCEHSAPIKGPERVLELLVGNAYWDCVNKEWGCNEPVSGFDWKEHVRGCKKKPAFSCYHPGCKHVMESTREVVPHLLRAHGGLIYQEESVVNGVLYIEVPFYEIDTYEETGNLNITQAILQVRGSHYILGSHVADNELQIWVWSIQSNGNNLQCLMKLKPVGDEKEGELRYVSTCFAYIIPPARIINEGNVFIVGLRQLRKKYLRNDEIGQHWRVGVLIKDQEGPNLAAM